MFPYDKLEKFLTPIKLICPPHSLPLVPPLNPSLQRTGGGGGDYLGQEIIERLVASTVCPMYFGFGPASLMANTWADGESGSRDGRRNDKDGGERICRVDLGTPSAWRETQGEGGRQTRWLTYIGWNIDNSSQTTWPVYFRLLWLTTSNARWPLIRLFLICWYLCRKRTVNILNILWSSFFSSAWWATLATMTVKKCIVSFLCLCCR